MLSFSTGLFAFTRETTHFVAMFVRDNNLLELRQGEVRWKVRLHSTCSPL